MAGLGIPTSRALALVASRTPVQRESWETAAVVTRVAPSFVRFGMFEHFATATAGRAAPAGRPCDCRAFCPLPRRAPALSGLVYRGDCRQRPAGGRLAGGGLCHGVLNTDNMSILGLTLDYGPFGFLDGFDPEHICNHSDHHGRYSYRRQPYIVQWNLQRLAAALWPLIREPELLAALEGYQAAYEAALAERMRASWACWPGATATGAY